MIGVPQNILSEFGVLRGRQIGLWIDQEFGRHLDQPERTAQVVGGNAQKRVLQIVQAAQFVIALLDGRLLRGDLRHQPPLLHDDGQLLRNVPERINVGVIVSMRAHTGKEDKTDRHAVGHQRAGQRGIQPFGDDQPG